MTVSWTPKNIEKLRYLFVVEEKTFSEIAAIMRTTRSAIAGMVNRRKIKREPKFKPKPVARVRKPKPTEVTMKPVKPPPDPVNGPISMHDMKSSSCRFLVCDDPKDLVICGQPVDGDLSPYCKEHRRICYSGFSAAGRAQRTADPAVAK